MVFGSTLHVIGLLLAVLSILMLNTQTSMGQTANLIVKNPQVWTNVEQNIKVQFKYQPQSPVLDQPTQLKFVVQNLKTGQFIKNLHANILVTHNASGQFGNYRFRNITVSNGQFSVIYRFQDTGIFEIITRVSAPDVAVLAPFRVIVPLQPYPP